MKLPGSSRQLRTVKVYCKFALFAFFFLMALLQTKAAENSGAEQTAPEYPAVGMPMPDDFVLRNISYFNKTEARISDFRGKWLVLDFWTLHCGTCIASFPRINEEARIFEGKVQFMLVGAPLSYDPRGSIEKTYDAIRRRNGLGLPCAFDSLLFKRYDLFNVPYIIVINPDGIVHAITTYIDSASLAGLLRGESPSLRRAFRAHEAKGYIEFDNSKPFLVNGNGGADSDFAYRSLIKKCGLELKKDYREKVEDSTELFQAIRIGVEDLFKFAYIGQLRWAMLSPEDSALTAEIWPHPLLKIKDLAVFKSDPELGVNTYCYSLKVPRSKATRRYLMKVMQDDLEHYFGYKGEFVEMEMPCLKLVVKDVNKLHIWTVGDTSTSHVIEYPLKQYWANMSIRVLMQQLGEISESEDLPLIDDTGLRSGLNLLIDCYWEDPKDVKRALNYNGLDLIHSTKKMKVLVIKET